MTTKDQAIASNKQFIEKFDELLPAPAGVFEMNAKDQAIAWYSQTPKRTRVTQINMDGEDGWMPLFPRPAPDCRTCAQYRETEGICEYPLNHGLKQCTNGDKYEAAPKVVLWRTE